MGDLEPSVRERNARSRAAATNFGGRLKYIEALETHWPELLTTLSAEALPAFLEWRRHFPKQAAPRTFAQTDPTVACAVQRWAASHGISDEWLLDAVVQTLANLSHPRTSHLCVYFPPEFDSPEFVFPIRVMWVPWNEFPWNEFERNLMKQFKEQLIAYREKVQRLWGEDKPEAKTHAIWAVLWQKGMSAGQIELWLRRERRRGARATAIHKAVREYARSIGLTLRAGRTGPKRKT
jgi:hypothetical protein